MPWQPLQTLGHIDQIADLLVLIVRLFKVRIHGQGFFQCHTQIIGDHLGDGVAQGIRKAQDPSHVPDHTLGSQGTKGDDLHHLVLAVLAHNIVNDFLASLVTEVNINIRHGYPLRVKETLKQKAVAHGVDVCNAQCI